MGFEVTAAAYDSFMGRYSAPLASEFVAFVGTGNGAQALDVGCGPGALTAELVARLGGAAVSAVDPSEPFITHLGARFPEVDARRANAEALPFADNAFDLALAQLVVHFMQDPVAGLKEMTRVTRPGGRVAACVWDHAGGGGPLSTFWAAVRDLGPEVRDESQLPGAREGHLAELFVMAGLGEVTASSLTVRVEFSTFEDWWGPFLLGVGPAGDHVARLNPVQREALRTRCAELVPAAPFEVAATTWVALGTAS